MIEQLYIPTYKRQSSQLTFDGLPSKWKDKTILVVHPEEVHKDYPTLSCPIQGTGIAPVRKWIAEHGQGKRYAVIDDDISFIYTRRENEEGSSNRKLTDDEFDNMMSEMNYWIDEGFIHVGCDAAWNPPTRDKDYKVNSRICGNVFYDGTKLPIEKIDWTGLKIAEDYYVTLQLLTMGYQNKISLKYRVDPHETQSKGGCSTFRSLDVHNDAMKQLQQKFPSFVKLKEKVAKNSGEWSNKVKLAAVIQWKKAYQSSQVNTLESFMK